MDGRIIQIQIQIILLLHYNVLQRQTEFDPSYGNPIIDDDDRSIFFKPTLVPIGAHDKHYCKPIGVSIFFQQNHSYSCSHDNIVIL